MGIAPDSSHGVAIPDAYAFYALCSITAGLSASTAPPWQAGQSNFGIAISRLLSHRRQAPSAAAASRTQRPLSCILIVPGYRRVPRGAVLRRPDAASVPQSNRSPRGGISRSRSRHPLLLSCSDNPAEAPLVGRSGRTWWALTLSRIILHRPERRRRLSPVGHCTAWSDFVASTCRSAASGGSPLPAVLLRQSGNAALSGRAMLARGLFARRGRSRRPAPMSSGSTRALGIRASPARDRVSDISPPQRSAASSLRRANRSARGRLRSPMAESGENRPFRAARCGDCAATQSHPRQRGHPRQPPGATALTGAGRRAKTQTAEPGTRRRSAANCRARSIGRSGTLPGSAERSVNQHRRAAGAYACHRLRLAYPNAAASAWLRCAATSSLDDADKTGRASPRRRDARSKSARSSLRLRPSQAYLAFEKSAARVTDELLGLVWHSPDGRAGGAAPDCWPRSLPTTSRGSHRASTATVARVFSRARFLESRTLDSC